jgi:hypothetical protein
MCDYVKILLDFRPQGRSFGAMGGSFADAKEILQIYSNQTK